MSISFTGFKNVSALQVTFPQREGSASDMYSVTMQVYDDPKNKDLSDYKKIKAKSSNLSIRSLADSRFINVQLLKSPKDSYIGINSTFIPVERDTMPILSFVAKLLKRVQNSEPDKLVVDKCYHNGEDYNRMVLPGVDLAEFFGDSYDAISDCIVSPKNVTNQAGCILQGLEDMVIDYLA